MRSKYLGCQNPDTSQLKILKKNYNGTPKVQKLKKFKLELPTDKPKKEMKMNFSLHNMNLLDCKTIEQK